jgi:hypothetical protein
VIAGVDPKIPPALHTDLDHTIIFGDCPAAATGRVKELRNAMLLHGQGVVAAGCPPYRPAMEAVEHHLAKLGYLRPEAAQEKYEANVKRIYGYYREVDPTWVPE